MQGSVPCVRVVSSVILEVVARCLSVLQFQQEASGALGVCFLKKGRI